MAAGDHIYCSRGAYEHHGIDCGDGSAIHFAGQAQEKESALIRRVSIADFAKGDVIHVRAYSHNYPAAIVLSRAFSSLGDTGYSILWNNCEHFARWCKTGEQFSSQVALRAGQAGSAASVSGGVALGIGSVTAAGSAAGLGGGAATMSGLAQLGGSAAGGIALCAAAPAFIAGSVMNATICRDDAAAPPVERVARQAARRGVAVGGALGTVGAVAAVSAAGVPGLSAVGITTGLATIGGSVGGGMLAVAALVFALPFAAAGLFGWLAYRGLR